jgi:hypothetical protein
MKRRLALALTGLTLIAIPRLVPDPWRPVISITGAIAMVTVVVALLLRDHIRGRRTKGRYGDLRAAFHREIEDLKKDLKS